MSNGYGQIFLLLLAIGLILLAASGKGKAVWDLLTSGNTQTTTSSSSGTNKGTATVEATIPDYDHADSGRAGVTA